MNMDFALLNAYVGLIPLLLGVLIPIATEAMTKASAPTHVKSGVAIALSLLAGAVSTVSVDALSAGVAGIDDYLIAIAIAWAFSGRAYLAGVANRIIAAQPGKGIGTPNQMS